MAYPQSDILPYIDVRGRKILLAEIGPRETGELISILFGEGYVFQEANSLAHTLEIYPSLMPHLVLVHFGADRNGLEICRTLKRTYNDNCAPIIFVTATNSTDDVVGGFNEGAVDYLARPFAAAEVKARIRLQLQSQIMAEQESSLVDQLGQADEEKTKLLKTAANDLRDPLTAICQLAGFLRKGAVGPLLPDQLDLIDAIRSASESMLGMINELLDVTTIESGDFKLQLGPTNMGELLGQCAYVANMEAAKKKTHVQFEKPSPPIMATVDSGKMKQVMDNLLSNAVKYSPPGSVVTAEIQNYAGLGCTFAVRDQGPGIPENERHKLFQEFGRLSTQPTAGEKSTGLGLSICRKIVEAHQGTISAENLPAGGCEFRVILMPPS